MTTDKHAKRAARELAARDGISYTAALLCLARRRIDVLFAMLRDGTFYESRPAEAA
ncbi:hypothetical protein [Streptomyces sp. NPDC018000]|uniref:hypothetical protein n=1 Tax=Streptomyces sp. NPDC018000 TaxID=3365028 RepID=UPI0037BB74D1